MSQKKQDNTDRKDRQCKYPDTQGTFGVPRLKSVYKLFYEYNQLETSASLDLSKYYDQEGVPMYESTE